MQRSTMVGIGIGAAILAIGGYVWAKGGGGGGENGGGGGGDAPQPDPYAPPAPQFKPAPGAMPTPAYQPPAPAPPRVVPVTQEQGSGGTPGRTVTEGPPGTGTVIVTEPAKPFSVTDPSTWW